MGGAEHRSIVIPAGNSAGVEFCPMDTAMGNAENIDGLMYVQGVP